MKKSILVKLTFPFNWPIQQQLPRNNQNFNNLNFIINEDISECDYWVIYEGLNHPETTICKKENVILITGEPMARKQYKKDFIDQFGLVISSHNLKNKNAMQYIQAQPWLIEKSYDDLEKIHTIKKSKILCAISSDKEFTYGHRQRLKFILQAKKYFGNKVDIYGRGINTFSNKWDVLKSYKYSIVVENTQENDYITEKLYDCYLTHTFPFYYGAPNISRYFSKKSHKEINIRDFNKSMYIIEQTIKKHYHYDNHLPYLLEAKKKCLQDYNLFFLIEKLIKKRQLHLENKAIITIMPENTQLNFVNSIVNYYNAHIRKV